MKGGQTGLSNKAVSCSFVLSDWTLLIQLASKVPEAQTVISTISSLKN